MFTLQELYLKEIEGNAVAVEENVRNSELASFVIIGGSNDTEYEFELTSDSEFVRITGNALMVSSVEVPL